MILLDSDHISVFFDLRQSLRPSLASRLETVHEEVGLPIVAVEEHLRAWLAAIHRAREPLKQIFPYMEFSRFLDFLRNATIAAWDEPAAAHFVRLRKLAVRIGTQDLKIAAIALANGATLLSANLVDFQKVPGLHVEDWLNR